MNPDPASLVQAQVTDRGNSPNPEDYGDYPVLLRGREATLLGPAPIDTNWLERQLKAGGKIISAEDWARFPLAGR